MKKTKTIRASELGSYLYCKRAWWYRYRGIAPGNQADLERGTTFHQQHGRQVMAASLLRLLGWGLLLAALIALVVALTNNLVVP